MASRAAWGCCDARICPACIRHDRQRRRAQIAPQARRSAAFNVQDPFGSDDVSTVIGMSPKGWANLASARRGRKQDRGNDQARNVAPVPVGVDRRGVDRSTRTTGRLMPAWRNWACRSSVTLVAVTVAGVRIVETDTRQLGRPCGDLRPGRATAAGVRTRIRSAGAPWPIQVSVTGRALAADARAANSVQGKELAHANSPVSGEPSRT